ncbi:LuxR C-terminal-related transcriptional regulator [Sphingorhabdus sp. EL138]|uniref:helix-turn-helix transcriptional regulator n=1 Tax=Sphingorhabdus sp. EL138 TaxID=2073156 RepID=UPI000D688D97|nr:LuxR C-terminal-related transcriptional regulator [Sphingorhabdus sp. EL138]
MEPKTEVRKPSLQSREVVVAIAIVALQAIAAIFFVVDGVDDFILSDENGTTTFEDVVECIVAVILFAGVIIGARHTRRLMAEARKRDDALAVARGALADIANLRFQEWQLSAGEAEVALFAIKGCSVSEIAEMRDVAAGTVRSQLSQIYLKAGVTNQSMLIALFIEELL